MSLRFVLLLVILCLLLPSAPAASRSCTGIIDPPRVDQDTLLCADNYYPHNYPQGINITKDNIVFDCGTSVMHGEFLNAGLVLVNRRNVTIRNCQIANYDIGILIKNSSQVKIINANLIRNQVGIKLVGSSGVVVENSYDISLKKPLQLVNSTGNSFHYLNKRLGGDGCRLNQCNAPTGLAAHDIAAEKAKAPSKALGRSLRDSIRKWIYPGSSRFS
ncbi:MAG: right-handed parallel beta-helix repeat-containing protein [Candidatus Woesearchaeota archaeon]